MKSFTYGDETLKERELMIAVPSMVIGVTILSLPRQIATFTSASDGWISLMMIGLLATLMIWVVGTIASAFPGQSFLSYASAIISRPVAIVFTLVHALLGLILSALVIRTLADIAKHYLFERTPLEVIALTFLLVVVYAVAGSRVGLFRLNVLFFPIIFFIAFVVMMFDMKWFDINNFLPVFKTDLQGYMRAGLQSLLSYMGGGIFLFYVALLEKPKKAPRTLAIGMTFSILFYSVIVLMCIAVFGNVATSNMIYPTVELAKSVEVTGGVLERFESIFFVVWIMAVFNSTALATDVAVFAFQSIFKKASKLKILYILAPTIFFISMLPENFSQLTAFKTIFGVSAALFTYTTVFLLFVIAKVRGVGQSG